MNELQSFNCNYPSFTGAANFQTSSSGIEMQPIVYYGNEITDKVESTDTGKYSIFDIADWFLNKSNMTHKKLQKLCYYAQAWCYAIKGFRLIDTDFEAWIHGPVSPALWEKFKSFGFDTIKLRGYKDDVIETQDKHLLDDVWETYGDYTGNALEALSHRERPWLDARTGYAEDERCNVVISPKAMADYYRSIYNAN